MMVTNLPVPASCISVFPMRRVTFSLDPSCCRSHHEVKPSIQNACEQRASLLGVSNDLLSLLRTYCGGYSQV